MSLDLTKFASPGTYVCVARTGSGKSHVLKFILYHLIKKGYIKDCIAASTTARMNDDYDFLDKRFILTDLKEDNLAYLTHVISQRAKYREETGQMPPGLALILDDVAYTEGYRNDFLSGLATKARHFNIWFFYSSQAVKILTPAIRENARVVMLFQVSNWQYLDSLYDLCPYGSNKKDLMNYMRENVHSHKFLSYFAGSKDREETKFKIEIAPAQIPNFKLK